MADEAELRRQADEADNGGEAQKEAAAKLREAADLQKKADEAAASAAKKPDEAGFFG